MTKRIITWLDLQGRYRVTSPAYDDYFHADKTDDELIDLVINEPVKGLRAHYGLPVDHVFHLVENEDQRERLKHCCGQYFRWGVFWTPDNDGLTLSNGSPRLTRDGRNGSWEMDTDGRPKINLAKARGVHMDMIRVVRNNELVKLDAVYLRALEARDTPSQDAITTQKQTLRDIPQTFDLTTQTPRQLMAKWPLELPVRVA